MPSPRDAGTLAARILTSLIFVGAGLTQTTDPQQALNMINGRGLPLAQVLYTASTAVLLAGALSLVLGWHTRWGAVALLLFIVPATLLFHLRSDQTDIELFTRDLAIAGGLILLIQQGPGSLSLDARAERRRGALPKAGTRHATAAVTSAARPTALRSASLATVPSDAPTAD